MNVEEKVIVITGAARGIGQEYARYLAGLRARVVVADINDCAHMLDLVRSEKGTAVPAKLDVASAASAMEMARTDAAHEGGRALRRRREQVTQRRHRAVVQVGPALPQRVERTGSTAIAMSAFLIGRQGQALSMRQGNDRAANYGTYPLVGNSRDLADFQSRSTPRAKKMGNCGWFAPDGTM